MEGSTQGNSLGRVNLDGIPPGVLGIARVIHEAGFGVWIVGGALRDLILGVTPRDWDLVTTALPHHVTNLFPKVIPVGIRHGTVCVHLGGTAVEVTSCSWSEQGGILRDLGRRDFTVNALALAYPEGVVLDPYEGERDLHLGVLRAVGDAKSRFREDPLRVIRACRLVAYYDFHIEPATFRALMEETSRLKSVAQERIRDEIYKLILGKQLGGAFECLRRGGVLKQVLPEFDEPGSGGSGAPCSSERYLHMVATMAGCPERLNLRLAALFQHIGKHGTKESCKESPLNESSFRESAKVAALVLKRWRASGHQIRTITDIIKYQPPEGIRNWDDPTIRRYLNRIDSPLLEDILLLAQADRSARADSQRLLDEYASFRFRAHSLLESGEVVPIGELAVNGKDVMEILGIDSGPLVGRWLRKLHRMVLENPSLNQRKILMDFLRKSEL